MERLNSWISPAATHVLGWTLIHSLWQCLAIAALAAAAMAFSRRPSIRYLVGVGALSLMLAAPIATLLFLVKPEVPVQTALGSTPTAAISTPVTGGAPFVVAISSAGSRAVAAIAGSPRHILLPDVLPWLVSAWLCGVVLLSFRVAGGFLLLEHRRRSRTTVLRPIILAVCEDVQRQLGLERAVRYLECAWVQAPAVIGWLRPVVLLPVTAITGLSEPELRAVIAHELAHIRRLDAFVNLFQILVETLLFYHPGVWWLNKRIRADRELCCDDIAVSFTGNRLEYARALTRMAEWKDVPFLAMAANRGSLSHRVFHILGTKSSTMGQRMLGMTGSILFLAAALGAANALFGIVYPIPAAQAKANIKAVLVSRQAAVHQIVQQALQASGSVVTDATPILAGASVDESTPHDKGKEAKIDQPEKLVVSQPDPSWLAPTESLVTPTLAASNASPDATAGAKGAAVPQRSVAPTIPNESVQEATNVSDALQGKSVSEEHLKATCFYVSNNSVTGRVISPEKIEIPGFDCQPSYPNPVPGMAPLVFRYGGCRNPGRGTSRQCESVVMNVRFKDPTDASKMHLGELMTLGGVFQVITQNSVDYLFVRNAKVLHSDPFAPSTPDQQLENDAPGTAGTSNEVIHAPPVVPPTDLPLHVQERALEAPSIATSIPASPSPTQGKPTMRKTLMAASGVALLVSASQVGAQSNEAPTGAHDPDALTCDAPQLVPLARAVDWKICLQNSLVATLDEKGGPTLGSTIVRSYTDLPISEQPTGAGDPNAVTCQEAQLLSGSRSRGPITCAHNEFWAKLAAGGCVLTPNARFIIYAPTSKKWDTGACRHMKGRNGWLPPRFF